MCARRDPVWQVLQDLPNFYWDPLEAAKDSCTWLATSQWGGCSGCSASLLMPFSWSKSHRKRVHRQGSCHSEEGEEKCVTCLLFAVLCFFHMRVSLSSLSKAYTLNPLPNWLFHPFSFPMVCCSLYQVSCPSSRPSQAQYLERSMCFPHGAPARSAGSSRKWAVVLG